MRTGFHPLVKLGLLKRIAITNVDNWVYARRWDGGELFRTQNDQGMQFCQRLGDSGGNVENSGPRPDLSSQRVADEGDLSGLDEGGKLRYLMRRGCSIYLARIKGLLAGRYVSCNLGEFKPYSYNRHSLFAGENVYYVFFCRTYDPFRGQNIFPEMLCQICRDIWQADPLGAVYISAEIGNPASQRGIEKAGFERVGRLRYLAVLNQPLISRLSWRDYGPK